MANFGFVLTAIALPIYLYKSVHLHVQVIFLFNDRMCMVNCYTLTTRPLILILSPFFVFMPSAIDAPAQSLALPEVLVPSSFGALSTTSAGTSTAEHTKKEDLAVVTRPSFLTMTW